MKLKFILEGQEKEVLAEDGRTILDLALIAGLQTPYSCMEGRCRSCEAMISQGLTSENQKAGEKVRTCQALPKSDFVVINYDES